MAARCLDSTPDPVRWKVASIQPRLTEEKDESLRRLFTVLLFAFLIAKAVGTLARGPVGIEMDAFGYWRLSGLILGGDLLMLQEPIAYRTPGYPYFVAFSRAVAGPWALHTIVVMQSLLSLGSVLIAGLLAKRWTRLPWALPLTFLAAAPAVSAWTYNAAVLSESLFVFLLMLNLLAVTDYLSKETWGRATWVGATFALTLLTRPIVLLLWVPHLCLLLVAYLQQWLAQRRIRKRHRVEVRSPGGGELQLAARKERQLNHRVGRICLAGGVCAALIAPWLARNHHLFGSPRLTEFVGRNIWIVTFQDGSGAGLDLPTGVASDELQKRLRFVHQTDGWRDTWTVSNALVASGLSDAQADRLMQEVSADAIAVNQEAFAAKAFRRVVNFWRCAATDLPPQGGEQNYRGQVAWDESVPPIDWAIENRFSQSVLGNTLLTALLGAATLLLMINSPTRPYAIWVFLVFSYFAVVTGVLEIPAYRYRLVVEPLVAATIGGAAAVALSWRRKNVEIAA